VSAHDLAVFRRSASKMKMTAGAAVSQQQQLQTGMTMQSPQRPGEMLGASMLSRLSSIESNSTSLGDSVRSVTASALSSGGPALQPSALLSTPSSGNGGNSNTTSPLAQMMAKKFNMNMIPSNNVSSLPTTNLMGRRVHTVSAGLAYGSAGFQMDSNTRLSRFELLSNKNGGRSSLSISSGGSGGGGNSGYGKNEEWS
jgi:hypothetical protein